MKITGEIEPTGEITFLENLQVLKGTVVGQHHCWLIVRVGTGKHQVRYLVDPKQIVKEEK